MKRAPLLLIPLLLCLSAALHAADAVVADPCAASTACFDAGEFVAQVTQMTQSKERNNHFVRIHVRFRNITDRPLVLAYVKNSGTMTDDAGHRYKIDSRSKRTVQGIGQTDGRRADPQFVLQPGQSRQASFEYSRYVGKTVIGTVFSPDLSIERLEVLPNDQIRTQSEYILSFPNLNPSSVSASNTGNAIEELGRGLRSIFE